MTLIINGKIINGEILNPPDPIYLSRKHRPRLGTTGGGESEFGPFVASKIRPHFHRPDCKWAAYLTPANMLEFSSHAEAVEAGLKPCKTLSGVKVTR